MTLNGRRRLCLIALFATGSALSAGNTNDECARCHPAETEAHQHTRMANAMMPASASAFGKNAPSQGLHESGGGYSYSFSPAAGGGLTMTAERNGDAAQGVIEWVLGAGSQGQTPLVRTLNGVLESRLSYFPQMGQFGITIGQDAGASPNATAALGRLQSASALRACVGCHATLLTADSQPVTPGVQCGRCHAGAEEHAKGHGLPTNPGKLKPSDQLRLCGSCHRLTAPVDENQLENVRFQPLRLMKSACFSSGKLACTTCHTAHQDARRNDAAFYNSKCQACHSGQQAHSDARRTANCVGCHMPRVSLHPALTFTDHYIRVVTAPLVPRS